MSTGPDTADNVDNETSPKGLPEGNKATKQDEDNDGDGKAVKNGQPGVEAASNHGADPDNDDDSSSDNDNDGDGKATVKVRSGHWTSI